MPDSSSQTTVAIAGGGLAGLAAACALSDAGFHVTLFERRPFLGGRASSYEHPGTGEVVDNCQHVLFRCCTNLVAFYQRIGAADRLRWYDDMTFIEPGGRASYMRSSALPAPLNIAPSFLGFPFLAVADKFAIARAIASLVFAPPSDDRRPFLDWARSTGQTDTALRRFWEPILVSALNEDLDRVSVFAAAKVVRDSIKSPAARHMGVPTAPLTEIYNLAGNYVRSRGGDLQFRTSVEAFHPDARGVRLQITGREESFDYLVAALPFDVLDRILPESSESQPLRQQLAQFETSPITGIHLWFDRQISDLDHAVLLDRTVQWMFHKSRILDRFSGFSKMEAPKLSRSGGSYVELVVSSSKSLVEKSRAEIIELALGELREFFPAAREANLVKSIVIKEIKATFSPRPGIEALRPAPQTVWPRVFLAGDWTATGWPATMEGAVRSGYLAADSVLRAAGVSKPSSLVSDLPATGLMRFFG